MLVVDRRTSCSQDVPMRQKSRKRHGGPPKREYGPGERVALSLRMTPDLKRRLDAVAEAGGRSQSQEAEIRLEKSFWMDDLVGARLIRRGLLKPKT